jgi:probable rRNA maturation factor
MAVRQANLRGHTSEAELALYITHGLLHNLGFDDSAENQARKMHETEDEILQEFGYGMVYNKDTRTKEH